MLQVNTPTLVDMHVMCANCALPRSILSAFVSCTLQASESATRTHKDIRSDKRNLRESEWSKCVALSDSERTAARSVGLAAARDVHGRGRPGISTHPRRRGQWIQWLGRLAFVRIQSSRLHDSARATDRRLFSPWGCWRFEELFVSPTLLLVLLDSGQRKRSAVSVVGLLLPRARASRAICACLVM